MNSAILKMVLGEDAEKITTMLHQAGEQVAITVERVEKIERAQMQMALSLTRIETALACSPHNEEGAPPPALVALIVETIKEFKAKEENENATENN